MILFPITFLLNKEQIVGFLSKRIMSTVIKKMLSRVILEERLNPSL